MYKETRNRFYSVSKLNCVIHFHALDPKGNLGVTVNSCLLIWCEVFIDAYPKPNLRIWLWNLQSQFSGFWKKKGSIQVTYGIWVYINTNAYEITNIFFHRIRTHIWKTIFNSLFYIRMSKYAFQMSDAFTVALDIWMNERVEIRIRREIWRLKNFLRILSIFQWVRMRANTSARLKTLSIWNWELL